MLTAFNITLQGVFWWYQKKAVSLHRQSEERLLMTTWEKRVSGLSPYVNKNH